MKLLFLTLFSTTLSLPLSAFALPFDQGNVVELTGTKEYSNGQTTQFVFHGFLIKSRASKKTYVVTSERALIGLTDLTARRTVKPTSRSQTFRDVKIVAYGEGVDAAILEISHREGEIQKKKLPDILYVPDSLPAEAILVNLPGKPNATVKVVNDRNASFMGQVGVVGLPTTRLLSGSPVTNGQGAVLGVYASAVKAGKATFGVFTHGKEIRSLLSRLKKQPSAPQTVREWNTAIAKTWFGYWYRASLDHRLHVRNYLLQKAFEKNAQAYAARYSLANALLANDDYLDKETLAYLKQLLENVGSYVPADPGVFIAQADVLERLGEIDAAYEKLRWVCAYKPSYSDETLIRKTKSLFSMIDN